MVTGLAGRVEVVVVTVVVMYQNISVSVCRSSRVSPCINQCPVSQPSWPPPAPLCHSLMNIVHPPPAARRAGHIIITFSPFV